MSLDKTLAFTRLFVVEYAAWFVGWNSAVLYQFSAVVVIVGWSKQVILFIDIVSDYNVTSKLVNAPIAWNKSAEQFYITGQAINLPAIAITIAITILLISGIRQTVSINLILVGFKIIVLFIFIFASSAHVVYDNYKPFIPPNQGMHLSD